MGTNLFPALLGETQAAEHIFELCHVERCQLILQIHLNDCNSSEKVLCSIEHKLAC